MKQVQLLIAVVGVLAALNVNASQRSVVEFHIKAGTGHGSWNTARETLVVHVGDVVRIINDDDIVHALHTDDGRPCEHGSDMEANGGVYECVVAEAYDSAAEGALVDHYEPAARFWLTAQ